MMLGKMIAAYRKQNGLSLRELSKQTGVTVMTLWRLENGQAERCKQWLPIVRWVFGK